MKVIKSVILKSPTVAEVTFEETGLITKEQTQNMLVQANKELSDLDELNNVSLTTHNFVGGYLETQKMLRTQKKAYAEQILAEFK